MTQHHTRSSVTSNPIRRSLAMGSFLVLAGAILTLSCNKGVQVPPTNPLPQGHDSLYSWKIVRDTTGQHPGIVDVWFVDAMKGFFAGADNNLYQSADGGKTWSLIPHSTSPTFLDNLFFVNAQYGFALASGNLEVTRDGGATWSLKSMATNQNISIFFTSPATGYCGDALAGLYKTTDTGNNWTPVYNNGSPGVYPYFFNDKDGFVFGGDGFIDSTHSGGSGWRTVAQTLAVNSSADAFNILQFVDSLNGFYGCKNGVWKTTNGGFTWNSIRSGGGTINIVQFFDANTGYSVVDSQIYKTIDGGQSWSTSCKLTGDIFTGLHFINATTGWACTANGFIFQITQ
jgi:photosystem II stability/assembly factor-like uncharacterized protein